LASHTRWVESNTSIEFLPLYCDENYIGNIVLTYAPRHLSAYLQIYIGDERFTGKGLGAKFMVKAHEYIFNEKKYNRIWLHIREHNEIAQKLYLKLGYQKEGFERESILEEGKFYNQVTMSLLAREFSTKK
jgi:RimJ/RimL family protein N-acetyltransferase